MSTTPVSVTCLENGRVIGKVKVDHFIAQCRAILDKQGVLVGDDVRSRTASWRGGQCEAIALLRPKNTEEVAAIMRLCSEQGQPIVVQGGKTGLVGGCISRGSDVALSMERMNRIEQLDRSSRTMTVEAGVILQHIQERAREVGLQFPLDLGGRGSATIGGNISTNAGGNRVIRYGMTRNLVLGLEAVLADGTIISSMDKVIKNNAGYDLKQLFIGSEGTLGTVTRAVLRLSPALPSEQCALLAAPSFDDVISILHYCDQQFGGALSAFEVMWNSYFKAVTVEAQTASKKENNKRDSSPLCKPAPMSREHPFYILLETQGADPEHHNQLFERTLATLLEKGWIEDAVLPKSVSERDALWAIRDNIEATHIWGPVFYFDISLPINHVAKFLDQADRALKAKWPQLKHAVFGHLGDGNIHIIACIGSDDPAQRYAFDDTLYRCLAPFGGSISAEHGIGTEKKPFLHYSRSESEIALMRTLKQALDPKGILNLGKVI